MEVNNKQRQRSAYAAPTRSVLAPGGTWTAPDARIEYIQSTGNLPTRTRHETRIFMPDKKTLFVPVLLITVGAGWLLTTLGIAPGINWIWTLGLAILGILAFLISGIDKMTVVVGSLLIVASLLSVLRQTERLPIDHELPILVMVTGVLLLIARYQSIPVPAWFHETPGDKR